LGRDSLGQKAFEQIERLGMETEFIQWDESYPTGTVDVRFLKPGQPDFTIIENVAYDRIELNTQMIDLVESADCLCFGTLIQRCDISRKTLRELLDRFAHRNHASAGLSKNAAPRAPLALLDINLRKNCYTEETIRESIGRADVLKLNEEEAPVLAKLYGASSTSLPDVAQRLMEKTSLEYCVITLGPKGVFAASVQPELLYLPTYRVQLEDSCGAGDAFTAGFIHCLLGGESLTRACQFGNAMGALVAAQIGATQRLSLREVEALIEAADVEEIDPALKGFLP
jgi:fructokinase